MTKRSACRNQLLNEVEGAENAGTLAAGEHADASGNAHADPRRA
jgi:hypothetical protein